MSVRSATMPMSAWHRGVGRHPHGHDHSVQVELLDKPRVAELLARPLTYDTVGRALAEPPGFTAFDRARRLPTRVSFDQAVDELMTWQVHTRSGLRVAASSLHVEINSVVLMRLGFGPAALKIPCRVVTVISEPHRHGFAYGTLQGHPEAGEEAFVVARNTDGTVDFSISAFSRPATRLARFGGPVSTYLQHRMTDRYLRSLD